MDSTPISLVFVDDETMLANLLSDFVEINFPHWKLVSFNNEIKALDYIRDNALNIDVVVCDIGMPYISGIEILEIIRKNHPHIRRIVLSGMIDTRSILGSNKFAEISLCKPIKSMDLCNKVSELVCSTRNQSN